MLRILRSRLGRAAENKQQKPAAITPLDNFDWRTKKPPQFRGFKPKYNISMGIRRDTPSELLSIDHDYLDRVNQRREILKQHEDTVCGFLPGGEQAVLEIYDYFLTEYLPIRYPTMFQLSQDKTIFNNLVTNRSFPTKPQDVRSALLNLGEIVEEELFLLMPDSDSYRLVAYVCCFPSSFDPAEKLGLLLRDIHKPVPGYEKIGPSMERFFAKLQVGSPIKRQNWSVQVHPELFDCEANHRVKSYDGPGEPSIEDASLQHSLPKRLFANGLQTFLRSELQTLTRFPNTQAILFSFKTYLFKVTDVKAQGQGPEFAEAIEGIRHGNVPEMWEYKGAPRWGETVCRYLRS
ncbi:uncharacterized protein NECHADRAFT_95312 [Fusarium vanettenii 77-13-4]|uniref:Uncharacterized protein n=1 Tax=Fusarium vanettenii (strain ATCC MYA-4622 / CBS 123669 / FGSC 9596 / NRRL 45880 / 77-13-4) TaxID=660122 RepID=C7Z433_FUSV7|nr:uncharacterized protein NECHADRAFT_95312 [Fusarium vanettenii 77-13-4]EEU41406.1 hypothetical protein NECHADRAFT_95312 [Fusarium vanettenii 77-13-4]